MDHALQSARRDHNGIRKSTRLKTRQQLKADKLRANTANFMIDHIGDYDGLYEDILNADQPDGRVRFRTTEKRLAAMSKPTALTGEPEVFALSPMLCKPVILVDTQLRSIMKYNLDKLRGEQVLYARYVPSGADVATSLQLCAVFSEPTPRQ